MVSFGVHSRDDPWLRQTYISVALPGGSAADRVAGVPSGTSHVVEHVLGRQTLWRGGLIDRIGGHFKIITTPEAIMVTLTVAPGIDPHPTLEMIESWWQNLPVSGEQLEAELNVIADEVRGASRQAKRLLFGQVMRELAPGSHLCEGTGGDLASLRSVDLAAVRRYHDVFGGFAGAICCAGAKLDRPDARVPTPWAPPEVAAPSPLAKVGRPPTVHNKARYVLLGARRFPGVRQGVLPALFVFAALRFAKLHPTQHAFLRRGIKVLRFELAAYANQSFVTATATVPGSEVKSALPLIFACLDEPFQPGDSERVRRAALHQLAAVLDDPPRRVRAGAQRMLLGATTLEEDFDSVASASHALVTESPGLGSVTSIKIGQLPLGDDG